MSSPYDKLESEDASRQRPTEQAGHDGLKLKVGDEEQAEASSSLNQAEKSMELTVSRDQLAQSDGCDQAAVSESASATAYGEPNSLIGTVFMGLVLAVGAGFAIVPGGQGVWSYALQGLSIAVWSACLYITCRTLKRCFSISELSPLKVAVATFLPLVAFAATPLTVTLLVQMYANLVPMKAWFPILCDWAIFMVSVSCYFVYWQYRWVSIVTRRLHAIEHLEVLLRQNKERPDIPTVGTCIGVNFGFVLYIWPWLMNIYLFSALLWIINRATAVLPKWRAMDVASRSEVEQIVNKGLIRKEAGTITVRYRSFAGVERWLKDRFAQRDYKKAAAMISLGVVFFGFGGPTYLLQLVAALLQQISISAGAQAAANAAALSSANQSAMSTLVGFLAWPVFALYVIYTWKPTNLELSSKGVRFLWRHPWFRVNGELIPWSRIDEIKMERPFGKTLPQDFSLCLMGRGRKLIEAKLACIPSSDDRADILECLDTWARQTSRSADVTELLRPPADHSYTELWLQALTAPPKRERLKPLMSGVMLKEKKYQINNEIGAGGQGFAYLATDRQSGKEVVLKEYILPVFVDMESRRAALERFEKEARTLQSLHCDGIVKLEDFFIEDHRAYLVLEHIEGESLKQLVERSGVLSQSDCVRLAQQMCSILSYLHGLTPPLVHRDFTPDNLILRPDGTLKLIDFNVAQQTEATFTGTVVGKHAYLPPEQFRGQAVPQSDIYAMGATLFYMLVGHDPEAISVSHPKSERADVGDAVDALVSRATALDLSRRYQDVSAVNEDLEKILMQPGFHS